MIKIGIDLDNPQDITYKVMEVLLVATFIYVISAAHANETMTANSTFLKRSLTERSRQRRSFYSTTDSLYCPPCEQLHCYKHRKRRLHCQGGYTVGVCGCCRVCAKLENELCGGEHNYLGRCDKGLTCETQPPTEVTFRREGVETVYKVNKGICKKASENLFAVPDQCKPKCDPDYCTKNPRAICSAKENAENSSHCQAECQHTSCRACQFVEPEKPCPKCALDDFKCIRNFGRCTRKKACKPKKYPCGNQTEVKKSKASKGKFLCYVPECISSEKQENLQ